MLFPNSKIKKATNKNTKVIIPVHLYGQSCQMEEIMKFANKNKIDVVPQGGNTSLCGAATPDKNGKSIIISLEKMNNVRSFNKASQSITVESGIILSQIHKIVEKENLFFPLSLGAKGSCMIGGNLSSNAGGILRVFAVAINMISERS